MSLVIPMLVNLLFFSTHYYPATATILPSLGGEGTSVMGLAQTAALQLIKGSGGVSGSGAVGLYEDILRSKRVVITVLNRTFKTSNNDKLLKLIDILKIEEENENERLLAGYDYVTESLLKVNRNIVKNITTVTIETPEPQLSVDVVNAFIEELDLFLREVNTKKASEQKAFIGFRIEDTDSLLKKSERKLRDFRETNKRIDNSPNLQLQQGRLLREVRVQEEVYITLKQQFELAKIEEVKNLSTITLLDEPIPSSKKSRPERRKIMFITVIIGLIFGISIAYIMEYLILFEKSISDSVSFKRIRTLLKTDVVFLRRMWWRFRGNSNDSYQDT